MPDRLKNEQFLRHCGLQALIGCLTGAVGTIIYISRFSSEERFLVLSLIYLSVYFSISLLVGVFRKFVLKKSFFGIELNQLRR